MKGEMQSMKPFAQLGKPLPLVFSDTQKIESKLLGFKITCLSENKYSSKDHSATNV